MVKFARIRDGHVVNIEVAGQEWLDAYDGPDAVVPFTDGAYPGARWDGSTFSDPSAV